MKEKVYLYSKKANRDEHYMKLLKDDVILRKQKRMSFSHPDDIIDGISENAYVVLDGRYFGKVYVLITCSPRMRLI